MSGLFNPVFGPLMSLPQPLPIILIAFFMTLFITLIYKWMTDQKLMKQLKDETKEMQKQIKGLKNDPTKMMGIQKQMMEKQMTLMKHSMKPTLITFIPIIIIFGWLNMNLGYLPINPEESFDTNAYFLTGSKGEVELIAPEQIEIIDNAVKNVSSEKVSWELKAKESGGFLLEYKFNDYSYFKEVLIVDENYGYTEPIKVFKDSLIKSIDIGYEKMIVMNMFGWKIGWLFSYIIFSLIFSISLRKMMGIH